MFVDDVEVSFTVPATLASDVESVVLPATVVGGSSSAGLTVTHTGGSGDADITISSVAVTGSGGGDFSSDVSVPVVLTPGGSLPVVVSFVPSVAGVTVGAVGVVP